MSGKAEAGEARRCGRSMEGTGRKRRRRSAKSYMAAFLSAVLLFTSVDYTQVQAAETSKENLENLLEHSETLDSPESSEIPASSDGEEAPENPEPSETNTESPENPEPSETNTESTENPDTGETNTESTENPEPSETNTESSENPEPSETDTEESEETEENTELPTETEEMPEEEQTSHPSEGMEAVDFVRTPEGAILISGFEPLPEDVSNIILEEKGTLEAAVSQMPSALKAYAYAYVYAEETKEESEQEEKEGQEEQQAEEQAEAEEGDEQEAAERECVLRELEIPVSWVCSEDYENTELERYDFQPKWNNESYSYATEGETVALPTITISFKTKMPAAEGAVATQEELKAALSAGLSEITLTADIPLTATLAVPASANIVLDGQGFSLRRGADENGDFTGPMLYLSGTENLLYLSGAENSEETSGSLTLTNICVDGQRVNAENHVGSSAIISYGNLILDEGAVVKGNCNYGTYTQNENGEKKTVINAYGGGIQVYGELTVTENALVAGNFADELGGGIYLADGATLYLHADVIRENSVSSDSGYGADLYATNGSTVYYNTAIDMTREGFYICEGAVLIGLDAPMAYADIPVDNNVEVYISIAEDSGYTREQIAELENKLERAGYKIISQRTSIDTTDLRNWYVYDHYDPAAWTALGSEWEQEYGGNYKRKYYPYSERMYLGTITNPAYTIGDWLKRQDEYGSTTYGVQLARFKEHIYTRNQGEYPEMTFAGYGVDGYADFLFYDPESDGEKVVDFDVNSAQVRTHTLQGTGFLVNTGVRGDTLDGYLVYYTYVDAGTGAKATKLAIYQLNGVDADSLHNGNIPFTNLIDQVSVTGWENEMSIQIKATPNSIEVRQQPKSATTDISESVPVLSCNLAGSTYSGFGPFVKYNSHYCPMASSFTYSNLRMYYTHPEYERTDMLNPLERADFTQEGTRKYFINLLGNDEHDYNEEMNLGKPYQEYLKEMQSEGVALITDKDAPFGEYLGDNLCNMGQGGGGNLLSVDELVNKIKAYIGSQTTTKLQHKIEAGDLKEASPQQSVGNIWLQSVADGGQLRSRLSGDSFDEGGYQIQIKDNISYYYGEDMEVIYEILKPNATAYEHLCTVRPYVGNTLDGAEADIPFTIKGAVGETDEHKLLTPATPFTIAKNQEKWPAGQYIVRQRISNGSVCGYAYFDLTWKNALFPTDPITPAPRPSTSNVESEQEQSTPVPASEPTIPEEPVPPVEEPVPAPVPNEIPEPKTGDTSHVQIYATVAMIAGLSYVMLYFADDERGMTEEKKKEIVGRIVRWAKRGRGKCLKRYVALTVIFFILVYYHSIGKCIPAECQELCNE